MRHVAEAKVEAGRLNVIGIDRGAGDYASAGDEVGDFL
jgi:hypothetical protein